MLQRRRFLAASALAAGGVRAQSTDFWARLREGGHVVLMRHAQTEPGVGDPPDFRLGECATQRKLSADGREQARRIGEAFRREAIRLDEVRSSAWMNRNGPPSSGTPPSVSSPPVVAPPLSSVPGSLPDSAGFGPSSVGIDPVPPPPVSPPDVDPIGASAGPSLLHAQSSTRAAMKALGDENLATAVMPAGCATATFMSRNSGMYRLTGSFKCNLPSSTSIITATPMTGLVIEAMRNIDAGVIGCFDCRSITPRAE